MEYPNRQVNPYARVTITLSNPPSIPISLSKILKEHSIPSMSRIKVSGIPSSGIGLSPSIETYLHEGIEATPLFPSVPLILRGYRLLTIFSKGTSLSVWYVRLNKGLYLHRAPISTVSEGRQSVLNPKLGRCGS